MHLSQREQEKLVIHAAAQFARSLRHGGDGYALARVLGPTIQAVNEVVRCLLADASTGLQGGDDSAP